MEIKNVISKYLYRLEPKPGGGFIARASDPSMPVLEAPTRIELQQKIKSTVLNGLKTDFPGLNLPPAHEMNFSFHVERNADGGFELHSAEPGTTPVSASSHDEVESHVAEKLITFFGKHLMPNLPEDLRAQLTSGNVKVFVSKTSGVTVRTSAQGPGTSAGSSLSGMLPSTAPIASTAGPVVGNSSPMFTGPTSIDSSPITPGNDSGTKVFRFLVAVLILAAVMFFWFHFR
jgi:hypothetical protein